MFFYDEDLQEEANVTQFCLFIQFVDRKVLFLECLMNIHCLIWIRLCQYCQVKGGQ